LKTIGIIAEYNPFHNGHKFHIEQAKRQTAADAVVVIMSGNYVQRGDCAIFDKQTRARAAIQGGADLVIELPTVCATQSAEIFAQSSVYLLNALGCIDFLAFGAEAEDIADIAEVARFLTSENPEFGELIREKLRSGISYATARESAVGELCGERFAAVLREPNNILGVEYLKALFKFGSKIEPILVRRKAVGHDESEAHGEFASASLVREMIASDGIESVAQLVPSECMEIYRNAQIHTLQSVEVAILANLRRSSTEEIARIADVSEGLENRILNAAKSSATLSELLDAAKTKRYTRARLRRIMLHAYLGITREDSTLPKYLKILDFSPRGQEILNKVKKSTELPLAKNFRQIESAESVKMWQDELKFDNLYELCANFVKK